MRHVPTLGTALMILGCGGQGAVPQTAAQPAPSAAPASSAPAPAAEDPADALHRAAIVVDTHDDVTQRLVVDGADIGQPLPDAMTDVPRMRAGGLDAEFLSVWVPPMLYPGERAYERSIAQFDAIGQLIAKNAASAVLARSAADVRAAAAAGKIAFLIGVEGGHSLGDAPDDKLIERLRDFYARGARYMTLTWSNSNRLGGSSGDDGKTKGLTPFGARVVQTMNELGMMVDISHVSDATFFDAVKASKLPVLASHSSSRALAVHHRNMTDDMIRAVHDNGGAVCVNFGPEFLDAEWAKKWEGIMAGARAEMGAIVKAHAPDMNAAQKAFGEKFRALAKDLPAVPASRVVDHIEHIAKVAGADHVCLGSDFDGIPAGPAGLDDVSKLPFVTHELLRRGFSPDDVKKILGENVLRVLAANEHPQK
jgi:membrane dipeptidase